MKKDVADEMLNEGASSLRLAQIQQDLDRLESTTHRADKAKACEEEALVLLIGLQAPCDSGGSPSVQRQWRLG